MAGFAAALGGAAGPLQEYGQQMRQILESRRDLFASLAQKRAEEETDPSMRDQWTQAAASALSGKDFGQILPKLIKAHDAHQQSTQALGQIAQQAGAVPQQTPPTPPGPGTAGQLGSVTPPPVTGNIPSDQPITGISPGPAGQDFSSLLTSAVPQPQAPPPAAQTTATAVPTTEGKIQVPPAPVQAPVGLATAAPITGIEGLPVPEDPNRIMQELTANPLWAAPANRPALLAAAQQRLTHQEALRQAIETKQTDLAYKRNAIEQAKKSGAWDKMPAWMQTAYEAEAGGLTAVPIGSSMNPHPLTSGTLGSQAPAGTLEFGTNKPVDPKTLYDTKYIPGYDQTVWMPSAPKTALTDTASGGRQVTNLQTGDAVAPASGAVAPSQIAPIIGITPNGAAGLTSAAGAAAGNAPTILPVTPPSFAGTQTSHSSVTSPSGVTTSTTTVRKVAPPGAPATGDQTPVPATAHGAPAVPTSGALPPATTVRPLDPKNPLDAQALLMARDANAASKFVTNAQDKKQLQERMTELGLTPGMITTSMRERAKNARLIVSHLNDINSIIDQAQKDGDLGVVATRWNDFLTNKLGDDPTKNHIFAQLSSQLGFLSTAVSMAHGGMRGGSSPTMVEHWEKALDAKDPGTLRAKLAQARKWMDGYSQLDNGLADNPIQGISTGTTAIPAATGAVKDPLGVR